jgi:hypothetical protein
MTGLGPVIHGNFAAREDVDGRIKSGHDEKRGDLRKCDCPAARGEGRSVHAVGSVDSLASLFGEA